jgi:hypothetical protein
MFSHVFTGVTDFDRAYRFYVAVLRILDIHQRFHAPSKPWAGWHSEGGARPLFAEANAKAHRDCDRTIMRTTTGRTFGALMATRYVWFVDRSARGC